MTKANHQEVINGFSKKSKCKQEEQGQKNSDEIHKRQQTILRLNINVHDFGDPNCLGFGNKKVAYCKNLHKYGIQDGFFARLRWARQKLN